MDQRRLGDRLTPREMFWSRSLIEPHKCLERKLVCRRGVGNYGLKERLLVFCCLAVFDRSAWVGIESNLMDTGKNFGILAGK